MSVDLNDKRALIRSILSENQDSKNNYTRFYDFSQFPEVVQHLQRFELLEQHNLANPYFRINDGVSSNHAFIEDRELINFSGYNYLGYSGHPAISQSAKDAIEKYGTSVSASRVVGGEIPIHSELEKEIAQLLRVEDAVAMVSGYATNVTTIGHIMRSQDLILHDELSHKSIVEGAILSGSRRIPFPHNDLVALENVLKESRSDYERVLIVVEGVYSMDGDIAPVPELIELKKKYGALLFIDEAHSIGTIGKTGCGVSEHYGLNSSDVDLWMATLSKSFASCGAYIAGKSVLIDYLKYNAPGFLYGVGMSPANAAAALASIREMRKNPDPVRRLRENARLFWELAKNAGFDIGLSFDSPVIPLIIGDSVHSLALSERLFEKNINVQPILYPAVPESQARLRFIISGLHTEEELQYTIKMVSETLAEL